MSLIFFPTGELPQECIESDEQLTDVELAEQALTGAPPPITEPAYDYVTPTDGNYPVLQGNIVEHFDDEIDDLSEFTYSDDGSSRLI